MSSFRGEARSVESQVVFDSSYFKSIDAVEAAIERNSKLQEIDARVKEEHIESLKKFYTVKTPINFSLLFVSSTFKVL